jgi:hypothetical protein
METVRKVSVSPEPKPCKPTKRGKEAPFRRYVYLRKGAVEYCLTPFSDGFWGFFSETQRLPWRSPPTPRSSPPILAMVTVLHNPEETRRITARPIA